MRTPDFICNVCLGHTPTVTDYDDGNQLLFVCPDCYLSLAPTIELDASIEPRETVECPNCGYEMGNQCGARCFRCNWKSSCSADPE